MNKHRKTFVLTADDFGISPRANKNILALVKAKKIDRVSLMVHGAFTPQELEKLRQSGVKIDLHLENDPKKKHRQGIKEGAFLRGVLFSLKLLSRQMRSGFVSLYWEQQIDQFHALLGRYPDGLNSHQHIHYFPPYFHLLTKLAQKKEISFIRFGKVALIPSNTSVYRILFWLHKKDRPTFLASHLQSTDHLVSLDWIKDLPIFLSQEPSGSLEIVCHPERKHELELIQKYF